MVKIGERKTLIGSGKANRISLPYYNIAAFSGQMQASLCPITKSKQQGATFTYADARHSRHRSRQLICITSLTGSLLTSLASGPVAATSDTDRKDGLWWVSEVAQSSLRQHCPPGFTALLQGEMMLLWYIAEHRGQKASLQCGRSHALTLKPWSSGRQNSMPASRPGDCLHQPN